MKPGHGVLGRVQGADAPQRLGGDRRPLCGTDGNAFAPKTFVVTIMCRPPVKSVVCRSFPLLSVERLRSTVYRLALTPDGPEVAACCTAEDKKIPVPPRGEAQKYKRAYARQRVWSNSPAEGTLTCE